MSKEKSGTLFYRRVAWLNGASDLLEKHLSKAHDALVTTHDRTFSAVFTQHGPGDSPSLVLNFTGKRIARGHRAYGGGPVARSCAVASGPARTG